MPNDDIRKILLQECVIPLQDDIIAGNKYLEIIEDKPNAVLKKLKILGLDTGDFCLSFDIGGGDNAKYSPCFQESCNSNILTINKRCDFILLKSFGGNDYVYFCDLKSNTLSRTKIFQQIKASEIFFKYLISLIEYEYGNTKFKKYIPRYFCIHDANSPSPRKSTINIKNRKEEDKLKFKKVKIKSDGLATINYNDL